MFQIRRLWPFLWRYRQQLCWSLAGTSIFTLLSVLSPLLLRWLVDHVIRPGEWDLLPIIALAIIVLPIITVSLRFASLRILMFASRRVIADLRLAVYRKILSLSMRYHATHAAGAIVLRLMDDVNLLQTLITSQAMQVLVNMIVLFFALGAALIISPELTLYLVLLLALYACAYHFFSRRIRAHSHQYRRSNDLVAGRLTETIEGVRQVRIYNREQWETDLFLERTKRSLSHSFDSGMDSVGLRTACTAISGFGSAAIMSLAAMKVLTTPMTYGDLLAFGAYLWMTVDPVVQLTVTVGQLNETWVSLCRVVELLDAEDTIAPNRGGPRIPAGRGHVEFRDIWFGYSRDEPLFTGLNLSVEPGSTVAIVGPTGCGKTTLTSLLMRYWEPDSGQILIDGIDVGSAELGGLRKLFGFVPQTPHLFVGTLGENISYGAPHATDAEIAAAVLLAELDEMVSSLPDGLNTVIGKQGMQLSVGEKQRVSIARAVLRDPTILVMDEATSALDSQSESLIQDALTRMLAERTAFVIAHRLSTIVNADRIVAMDHGNIVECGSHAELMGIKDGLYRRLYDELKGNAEEREGYESSTQATA